MPEKIVLQTDTAPKPFGNFSQSVKVGDMLYISGVLSLDPTTNKPAGGTPEEQATLIFKNLTAIMESMGAALSHVLTTTVYFVDLRDFPVFDKVSKDYFYFNPPARTSVGVSALPGNCRICVDAVAQLNLGADVSAAPGSSMM